MSLTIPDSLRASLDRPVAVFGAGVSGAGVVALLAALNVERVVYDQGRVAFAEGDAARHGLAVYSPGFLPHHPWLELARAAGMECLGELDFAAQFWRGRIVAVTGTNGKTTLAEFLTHALQRGGERAHATGNIGRAFTQLIVDTDGGSAGCIAVCEVSSFQAETLRRFRAEATLWTNFAEDHLERHPDMESYFRAKWNLVRHTAPGGLFAGSSVQPFAMRFQAGGADAAWVATAGQPADARLAGTAFAAYPQRENFLLAAAWWRTTGRSMDALYAAAGDFVIGRHRLARVGERDGVTYWNDSKATNFHAVEAALESFGRPVLLIAGGKAKGGDLSGFVARCRPRVRQLFLIGETRYELARAAASRRLPHRVCDTLASAVHAAAAAARPGDQVLLSPGFASFDMFRSYADRGEQFEALVHDLGIPANFG
jgi:UDP-N-acetylmuramoylalanine--D-glutamate ligase